MLIFSGCGQAQQRRLNFVVTGKWTGNWLATRVLLSNQMGKFLLGLLTGFILVILIGVIGFFAIASMRSKPPAIADGSTLILHVWGDVPEKPSLEFSIPGITDHNSLTVENVWSLLRRAANDSRIKAVIFEPEGASVGWPLCRRSTGIWKISASPASRRSQWLRSPTLRDYYMATACSKIYMPPTDLLNLKGIGFPRDESVFQEHRWMKTRRRQCWMWSTPALISDYGDQFTRASMSSETKEVMNSLAGRSLWRSAEHYHRERPGKRRGRRRSERLSTTGRFLPPRPKSTG